MFSLENFYYVLYTNLLKPANIHAAYFLPFGSTSPQDLNYQWANVEPLALNENRQHVSFFWDQEPLLIESFNKIYQRMLHTRKWCKLLANSEYSPLVKQICKEEQYVNWYYFYHGFAALDWYKDYQYLSLVEHQFTKVFISLNRLVTKDRSYRLLLGSKLIEQDLVKHGLVSLILDDIGAGTWQEELADPHTKLPQDQIPFIKNTLERLGKSLVVDHELPLGNFSAHSGPEELKLNQSALWHVVSETVFYYDKQHLTEKIFKPIVSKRPFILVGAQHNLAYLKSYGFKTFDRWIDESYDAEPDPTRRIEMVVDELNKLCSLSMPELKQMHQEMKEVLEHNFNHLYGDFKTIIIDELVDNFEGAVAQWNNNRLDGKQVDVSDINFTEVKKLLRN